MKIGDRVRFLSDVGGGIVKGFQNNNKVVLVEDEDGFQVPVMASDVVVVTTDDYNIAKVDTMGRNQKNAAKAEEPKTVKGNDTLSAKADEDDSETDLADMDISYKPSPVERPNGDKLSIFLVFVPQEPKQFTTTKFDCYIVNDCNYFISYIYMGKENNSFYVRHMGTVEPNTKVFVEEIEHAMLNDIERVGFQIMAYKQDRPFLLKQPLCVELKIDTTKFFKFHTFRESLFFDEPTLEYAVVHDDILPSQAQLYNVNACELQKAMMEKNDQPKPARAQKKQNTGLNDIIEVDLHASALLSTTAGMSSGDIKEYQLNVFRQTLNEHLKHKGQKIVFIHGKGEGALRSALLYELKRKYRNCTFQDASFQQYGFGATMVIIH